MNAKSSSDRTSVSGGDVPGAERELAVRLAGRSAAVARLAGRSAAVARLVDEHLSQFHELLLILLLGRISDWYRDAVRQPERETGAFAEARAVAEVLETAFAELREPIAVGFIEPFTYLPEADKTMVTATLPAALRAEFDAMDAWRPDSA